ncbi:MAG TPA: hypothetical protein VF054_03920 [Micromonosporaceae bacterium]
MSAEAVSGLRGHPSVGPAPHPAAHVAPPGQHQRAGAAVDIDTAEHHIAELCAHLAPVCESAVDPLEIAAAIEFDGIGDATVRQRYGFADTFSLAEELYRRVPRRPAEPSPAPDPYRVRARRSLLHGVLYGLPAACFPAAAGLLTGRAALIALLVSMLVSWSLSQGLAHLGYQRLGWTDRDQARRLLRAGLAAGMAILVLALAATAFVVPARAGALAFGVGQGAYMLGACVLMVLGVEWWLLVVLAPSVTGASVFLALGQPAALRYPAWAALAATPLLALLVAVLHTRRTGTGGRLVSAAELRGALPALGFGLLAAALLAFPIAAGVPGHPGANAGVLVAGLPLSLSMGPAELVLSWYRRRTQRLLRTTTHPRGFRLRARLVLVGAVLWYLGAAVLLTAGAVAVAVANRLVPPDRSMLAGLVTYLALGAAMFLALLLQTFRVRAVLLAAALALTGEFVFRDYGMSAQVAANVALLAVLGGYAVVVLGRAVRHAY